MVGGVVRDLILGRPLEDVDLAISTDALALVSGLTLNPPPDKVIKYKRYKNVTLEWEHRDAIGVARIDLSTFRSEKYPVPGGAPEIHDGAIEDDLLRRDFTINALGVQLGGGATGDIVDVCGGLNDLEQKLIEVIHERSFIDDPVRLIRAVRLEVRLGFSLGPLSIPLFKAAVKENAIATVPENRLQDEIRKAESEQFAAEILGKLKRWQIIK